MYIAKSSMQKYIYNAKACIMPKHLFGATNFSWTKQSWT